MTLNFGCICQQFFEILNFQKIHNPNHSPWVAHLIFVMVLIDEYTVSVLKVFKAGTVKG